MDFPDSKIDEIALKEEIDGTLTYNLTNFFIKHKFDPKFQHMYNVFVATSRDEIVYELLSEEVDFDYYLKTGVIDDY